MSNELTQKTTNMRRINEIAMKIITTQELFNKKDKSTEVMGEKENSNKKPTRRGGSKQHGQRHRPFHNPGALKARATKQQMHCLNIYCSLEGSSCNTKRTHLSSKAEKKISKAHLASMQLEMWGSNEEAAALRLQQHDFKVYFPDASITHFIHAFQILVLTCCSKLYLHILRYIDYKPKR